MITINGEDNVVYEIEEVCDLRADTFEELEKGFTFTDVNFSELREYYKDYVGRENNNYRKLIKVVRKREVEEMSYADILRGIYGQVYGSSSLIKTLCKELTWYNSDYIAQYISCTKGTRIEDMRNSLIKWLNSFSNMVSVDKEICFVNDKLSGSKTMYFLIDNTLSGIIGASFSTNYSSCYNCNGGDYKASLDYILSENLYDDSKKWYNIYYIKESAVDNIIKNKYIDLLELYNVKLGRNTLVTNGSQYMLGSTYGFNEVQNNVDFVKIVSSVIGGINLEDYYYERDYYVGYCYDNRGYRDLDGNNYTLSKKENNIDLDTLWEHDEIRLFSHGYICENCGREHDDEDEIIELANGEYACVECAFCCEGCGEWFLYSDDHYNVRGDLYCEDCVERE